MGRREANRGLFQGLTYVVCSTTQLHDYRLSLTTGAAGAVVLVTATALGPGSQQAQLFTGTLDLNGQSNVTVGSIRLAAGSASTLINGDASQASQLRKLHRFFGGQTPNIGGPGNLMLGGVLSDGGLNKIGSGTLMLASSNNSYSGGTTISAGTLAVTNAASLGTGGLSIGPATLEVSGNFGDARNISLTDPNAAIQVDSNITYSNSGTLSGNGGLTLSGPGTLILSGDANTYSGGTKVEAGPWR